MSGAVDVLLVEDDRRLADLTAQYLEQNGHRVVSVATGELALEQFARLQPRLVVLDVMLPGVDGLVVCRELRKISQTPVLMLTALDTDLNQVVGLEAGADDYVIKPVDPIVLLARVRALLRRAESRAPGSPLTATVVPPPDVVLGTLRVSGQSREVWLEDRPVVLTTQEFELLHLLARRAGHLVSRDDVCHAVRGIDYNGTDRSIDVRISRLRRKLGDSAEAPTRIKTVWGRGYLLVPDAWGAAS